MGWYTHKVEQLAGKQLIDSTTTRRVGTHAGFGAEMRMGRHAAFHADYRYTFLRFGGPIQSGPTRLPARSANPTSDHRLRRALPALLPGIHVDDRPDDILLTTDPGASPPRTTCAFPPSREALRRDLAGALARRALAGNAPLR